MTNTPTHNDIADVINQVNSIIPNIFNQEILIKKMQSVIEDLSIRVKDLESLVNNEIPTIDISSETIETNQSKISKKSKIQRDVK
jgi:cyclopropane fatty-acyl-phospholipid synthase-like methyltransferase